VTPFLLPAYISYILRGGTDLINDKLAKARLLPYVSLLYVALAGPSIYLLLKSSQNDYYTFFGFNMQKRALNSLLLFLAISVVLIPNLFRVQRKISRVIYWILTVGWLVTVFLPISTMLKFNRRVNNGTLVEIHGNTTRLMMAAYESNLQEMERLIKSGADVNARNDVNNTPLHFAAGATPIQNQIYRGSPEAVAYLIRQGADVNAQNKAGITPLMDAVYNNNVDSLKVLLAHGADVNKESKYVATALSEAIIRRYRDIAIELLHHGANPNFKDFTGSTPIKLAEKFHDNGLVDELKKYGAKE
jgi:hypothetical protein